MADFTVDLKPFCDVFVFEDRAANFAPNCTVLGTMFSDACTKFSEHYVFGDEVKRGKLESLAFMSGDSSNLKLLSKSE